MRGYAADPDYLTIYPDLAVAEVRAILAETEAHHGPETEYMIGWQSVVHMDTKWATALQADCQAALAESLAAFVDASTCAQCGSENDSNDSCSNQNCPLCPAYGAEA